MECDEKFSGDMGTDGEVDMEAKQFHCKARIIVPGHHGKGAMEVDAVLDSGSGISCISESLAKLLSRYVRGTQITFPFEGGRMAKVADGRRMPIAERTWRLQITLVTPWVPVLICVALAVIPGSDNVLVVGNKTLRERPELDVVSDLKRRR